MPRKDDHGFEIAFYESILRREPQFTEVVELLGGLYTKAGRIADGLRMDRKLVRMQPRNATAHYNLACSLALSERKDDALKMLAHAISLGYDDAVWMAKDPDLACLKHDAAFQKMLGAFKK